MLYNVIRVKEETKIKKRVQEENKMKKYNLHHTALTRGYVSVKEIEGIKEDYSGKFGTGYTIKRNNPNSTRYCFIEYWVEE